MNARNKVILIVALGVGACLLSVIFSQYFRGQEMRNQQILAQIKGVSPSIKHIRHLSHVFIQSADQAVWREILHNLETVRRELKVPAEAAQRWQAPLAQVETSLDEYLAILFKLNKPANRLKDEKIALQGGSLLLSQEVEKSIIQPFRKEEGARIYKGESIDPFKSRVKDTAYDLVALQIKHQNILLELLLSYDLNAYIAKKKALSEDLAKHKAQLQYMNVLMGNEKNIQKITESLDKKLGQLLLHEQTIVEIFTTLASLTGQLDASGSKLLAATQDLSARIVSDTLESSKLNQTLNWSLLLGILFALVLLGAMLGRDIIHFVQDLNHTQQELKENENNLMVTLNSIGDAVISTDARGIIARMNKEAERLTGWDREDAIGKPLDKVFTIVDEVTRQPLEGPVRKVMTQKRVIGISNHTILLSKNGAEYPISDSAAPIYTSAYQIIGVVMVFRDATEKRQAAAALTQSEKKYRDLFNDAPIMDIITRQEQGVPLIDEVNSTFLETMGHERKHVLGRCVLDFFAPESAQKFADGKLHHQVVRALEISLVTRDESVIDTLLYSRPEHNARGETMGMRLLFLNITELKRAEAEARQLEKRLIHAQRMEAIGTLAGGIAHDFNNILTAVIGYSELVLHQVEPDSRLHNNLQQILAAGLRARDLVRQILTFSRQDERQLTPLQIAPLIKEALKMLRSSLPTTISIKHSIEEDLDDVMADPTQVHQVIMNLCTNAAQAMEEEGGELLVSVSQVKLNAQDLRLHPGLKQGAHLKLSVQDSGLGIPPEILDKIYHPYFTTKEKGKGTGLGLSVVHGIVQSYGGAIYVYSEQGQGTTFNVYLPALKSKSLISRAQSEELPTGNEHILLVDDEVILTDVERQLLENLGYRITAYNDSQEALAVFRASPQDYDLVLTDLTMPGLTGDKLAAEMIKVRPELPIILCTGYSKKMTGQKNLGKTIRTIIHKPIVEAELAKTVREVLDQAPPG